MASENDLPDPYEGIAEFYDHEHDLLVQDIGMYLDFVVSAGDPVLELACGTGRIAVPIAEAGYAVVGADTSQAMLDRAMARARDSTAKTKPSFVRAGMVDADTIEGGPFGVVIMALDALSHLQSAEEQLVALKAVKSVLDPRGLLLLDVIHATPGNLQAFDRTTGLDSVWDLSSGGSVARFSSHTLHPASQSIDTYLWFDLTAPDGSIKRTATTIVQRYVSPGELHLMLEIAGFEQVMLYGGYQLEPFDDHSERLIVAAEVTRTG